MVQGIQDAVHDKQEGIHDPIHIDEDKYSDNRWSTLFQQQYRSIVTIHASFDGKETTGTGFFLDHDGYIVTAGHLLRTVQFKSDGKTYSTESGDGLNIPGKHTSHEIAKSVYVSYTPVGSTIHQTMEAEIVAIDGRADIGLLKIDTRGHQVTPVEFDETYAVPGEEVGIIGNAYGVDTHSMAVGHVRNGRWKDPHSQHMLSMLVTDVSTSQGISGAPILNRRGKVVGMHVAAFLPPDPQVFVSPESVPDQSTSQAVLPTGSDTIFTAVSATGEVLLPTAPTPEVGALTVGSFSDQQNRFVPKQTQQNSGNTTFGGGPLSKTLKRIVNAMISEHHKTTSSILYKPYMPMSDLKMTLKSTIRCAMVPNSAFYRRAVQTENLAVVFMETQIPSFASNRGFMVVALDANPGDDTSGDTELLRIGDVITHVNGQIVGTGPEESGVYDITWFLPTDTKVALTLVRANEEGECTKHIQHTIVPLPFALDFNSGDPQGFWDVVGGFFAGAGVGGLLGGVACLLAATASLPAVIVTVAITATVGAVVGAVGNSGP
jgi:S1-C subfamily serine protease